MEISGALSKHSWSQSSSAETYCLQWHLEKTKDLGHLWPLSKQLQRTDGQSSPSISHNEWAYSMSMSWWIHASTQKSLGNENTSILSSPGKGMRPVNAEYFHRTEPQQWQVPQKHLPQSCPGMILWDQHLSPSELIVWQAGLRLTCPALRSSLHLQVHKKESSRIAQEKYIGA